MHYDAQSKWNYIKNNKAANSLTMLVSILTKNSVIESTGKKQVKNILKQFGPILLSNFRVRESFRKSNKYSYIGFDDSKYLGQQAMIVVGHRVDKVTGKEILLIHKNYTCTMMKCSQA